MRRLSNSCAAIAPPTAAEQEPVVDRARAGDVVPAAAHGEGQSPRPRERDGPRDVVRPGVAEIDLGMRLSDLVAWQGVDKSTVTPQVRKLEEEYNVLLGNPARRTFMGDPTFAWATMQNGWTSDSWRTTPWLGWQVGGVRGRPRHCVPAATSGSPSAPTVSSASSPSWLAGSSSRAPFSRDSEASLAPKKSAGDGVRNAGEDLSGKVQGTADALAQVTDPLLPPVAAATQKVLNVVAELLRRTTDGLGGIPSWKSGQRVVGFSNVAVTPATRRTVPSIATMCATA